MFSVTYFVPSVLKSFNKSHIDLLGHRPTSGTENGAPRMNTPEIPKHTLAGIWIVWGAEILGDQRCDGKISRNKMITEPTDLQTTQQLSSWLSRYSDWLRAGRLRRRIWVPGASRIFSLSTSSIPALGSTQPPIQRMPGALSAGVRRPEREVDHSPETSAEIKKMWLYTSTPPYTCMA
jgi:hypothetical protein